MPIAPGTRLEHYEVTGPLGAGGMGEVYRALDTKLRREVALKILPHQFARDPARLARFEREAHVLASLNHPNIAAIYGLEQADELRFLVLELVEGPTLADRLKSGPLELAEAVRIAAEIAEALEAAHENGVVHRDLKPSNVKLTAGGKVKVLDFGLAKALGERDPATSAPAATALSTISMQETQAGIVMGTAPYMSPEQAEGKPTDKRSDVFSFGVVLYEMLSGSRCFDGKSISHIIVHVIEQEPNWAKLPDTVPAGVRQLLERCLQKDPAERLRDIGDLRLHLQALAKQGAAATRTTRVSATPASGRRNWSWPALAGATTLIALALAFLHFWPRNVPPPEVVRFDIAQSGNLTFANFLALSPDGRKLAFIAADRSGTPLLWVRSLDSIQARPLVGTEAAGGNPFWSPDSRYLVFSAQGKLQKIEAAGGPALTLCPIMAGLRGGFWTRDNRIVFAINAAAGLLEVNAAGGAPISLTTLNANEARHFYPALLPDGRHFLYTRAATATTGGIFIGSLDVKPEAQSLQRLLPDVSAIKYADAAPGSGFGYVLFVRGSTLMAQSFDNRRVQLAGEAVPLAEQVPTDALSVSTNGVLAYRAGAPTPGQQLTWFDRQGKVIGTAGEPSILTNNSAPSLAPDSNRAAVSRIDPQSGNADLWLFDFARGVSTRFTFDPGTDTVPVWSPDSSRIVFAGQRNGVWGIYQKSSNLLGGEELLFKSGSTPSYPTSWSRDGRFVLYQSANAGVLMLPVGSGDHMPVPLVKPQFNERGARFSPDGRFFTYLSMESGKDEIYVQTFDPSAAAGSQATAGKWMISKGGGLSAHWRGDGKEIFYLAPNDDLMAVEISTSPVFQAGVPKVLFNTRAASRFWDVTPDGQKFLLPVRVGESSAAPYSLVLNWTSLLRR